ncbi:MAG TPA: bifunctional phosphoribosylaminoimidazolecarboxamide formyltransferase/IMP cyclohydrolase [Candidatus Obscuribacterales bacterium]
MLNVLVSVSDKSGLEEFLAELQDLDDLEIIATSSTCKFLAEKGFSPKKVEDLTQFPEILDGRVKTLHPKVFAGILAKDTSAHMSCLKDIGVPGIDLVICNLYPFEKKLSEKAADDEMIENIDIGGVTLIRAAAKNHSRVAIICEPSQYSEVLESVKQNKGKFSFEMRRQLARFAFARTAEYDRQIANYFAQSAEKNGDGKKEEQLPPALTLSLAQFQALRYGENPHQAAVWCFDKRLSGQPSGFPPFEQLQGKELSSNNITDTYCLVRILRDAGAPSVCIIKHNNPCGVARGATLEEAYDKAYMTDPLAAFGGIFGFTGKVTEALAKRATEGFIEIIAAPEFDEGALKVLAGKKNVRVLKLRPWVLAPGGRDHWHARDLEDFGWILEKDVEPPVTGEQFQTVVGTAVDKKTMKDVDFAWNVVKHLTSNAIFVAKDGCSLGFGIGQTSRIASVRLALEQAGEKAKGAVLASDAFFPATDNIDAAAKAGISVIVQPGGSIKDKEVIEACEKAGITMLFTGQRCFKH